MLTRKQYDLLMYIQDCLLKDGIPPSFDEMKEKLQLKSKSGIHRLVTGLEERGFIRRLPHKARALEVVRLPENVPGEKPKHKGFNPTVISNDQPLGRPGMPVIEADAISLPCYGKIAAGTPIEALRDETAQIGVPTSILSSGKHYTLEVEGESMIEAGIFDGDTVIIEYCDTAESGNIVVALIDESEATLKRLRRKGDSIALEPANKEFETRIFGPDRVTVQGKLVGLMRSY